MPLASGRTLLHYRLIEKIGEGGMGIVWKALDTILDRSAAIKVLPEAFATDPERLLRFEREAKLLAALNHRHIATIHGLHEAEGVRFLAMEFVEGEDLAVLLSRGALTWDRAKRLGHRLESPRHHPRPLGCHQGSSRSVRDRPRTLASLRAGGEALGCTEPSPHRNDPRLARSRGSALPCHGVRGGGGPSRLAVSRCTDLG